MRTVDYRSVYRPIQKMVDTNLPGSAKLAKLISRLLIPRPTGELIANNQYDFQLYLNPLKDRSIERRLYYLGTYEAGTLLLLKHLLKKGDFFIDVGSNIGLMTIFAAYSVGNKGKVLAFEANPDTKSILARNVAINALENVQISGYALGAKKSKGKIYTKWETGRGAASLVKPEGASDFFDIQIVRLDEFDALPQQPIKALKMDIEGYELEALKGLGDILTNANAPALIVECSETRENLNSSKGDIYHFIKNANRNYYFFKLLKGKERKTKLIQIKTIDELPRHDNIFCLMPDHVDLIPESILKS